VGPHAFVPFFDIWMGHTFSLMLVHSFIVFVYFLGYVWPTCGFYKFILYVQNNVWHF